MQKTRTKILHLLTKNSDWGSLLCWAVSPRTA